MQGEKIGRGEVVEGNSMVGGGSLPGEALPTYLFALNIPKAGRFLSRLRDLPVPIIARIENDKVIFDPRTVLPKQESIFLRGLKACLKQIK